MGKNKLLFGSFLALLVLIIIELYIYANFSKFTEDDINITFVVTGDNLDAWESMKSGAQTAALDTRGQVTFLNSVVSAGAQGEIDMLERQFLDGADYVVIASGFYEEVKDYVDKNNLSSKVFFIKNGQPDIKNGIVADDYKLGEDYAAFINKNFYDKNLLVLYSDENINNSNIIEGLKQGFSDTGIEISVELLSNDEDLIDKYFEDAINDDFYDGAILLDSNLIDAAVKVDDLTSGSFNIYGIDDRQAAVYYLDSDLIKSLACKDDYTMGFLMVNQILTNKKAKDNQTPLYYIVKRSDIYMEQYEKVLFPFAK